MYTWRWLMLIESLFDVLPLKCNLDFIQSRSAWLLYRWSVCLWGRWSGLGWAAQSSPPSIGRARGASPSGTRQRWTTRTRTWSSLRKTKQQLVLKEIKQNFTWKLFFFYLSNLNWFYVLTTYVLWNKILQEVWQPSLK